MTKKDVLALLFNLGWIRLKVNQVLDIDELAERVLFNLFLGHVCSSSLGGFGWILVGRLFLVLFLCWCGLIHFRFCDIALDHTILFKWTIVFGTILKGEDAVAMLEVLIPVALILAAV